MQTQVNDRVNPAVPLDEKRRSPAPWVTEALDFAGGMIFAQEARSSALLGAGKRKPAVRADDRH